MGDLTPLADMRRNFEYLFHIIRSAAGVMVSRVMGLIRDIVIASVYGATGFTDLFFVAFAIPNLFRQFFAEGAIASAFVPILSDKLHKDNLALSNIASKNLTPESAHKTFSFHRPAAYNYLAQLVAAQTLFITILSLLLIIFAPYVILLFMPGIKGNYEAVRTGSALLRILMPYLLFVSIAGIFAGYLNMRGSYFTGYASTSLLNIFMITGAVLGYVQERNIYPLALSVIGGGICQVLLVYFYACSMGFKGGYLAPFDRDVTRTYKLVIPSLAGVGISQLNFLVGRIVASFLAAGSISWLFYANRLFQFPLGVFAITISTVSLTELSKARTNGDMDKIGCLIDRAVILVMFLLIPSTIGLLMLSEELVRLIYENDAFTKEDTLNTAVSLQMYSVGLIFFSLASVFARVFHSDKNTKTPVKIASIAFFVNLAGNLMLYKPLAHGGIALSSSIAAMVNAVLLYISIKDYRFNFKRYLPDILKILLASYVLIVVVWTGKHFSLHVLATILLACLSYFGALKLMEFDIRRIFR